METNINNLIRDAHGKASHQAVSVKEFAAYMGLEVEDITVANPPEVSSQQQ